MAAGSGYRSFGVKPEDKLYIIMPLYHTAAGMLGIGQTLLVGCTSVIRKKFSSTKFWNECVEHGCTVHLKLLPQQPRTFFEIKKFSGLSIHRRNMPLSFGSTLQPSRKTTQSSANVWQWIETTNLGRFRQSLRNKANRRNLRFYRRKRKFK